MARILVCDDEEGIRIFVARALELDGHDTVQAADGAHALEAMACGAQRFDLLITDIRMPVMDGIELARSVLQEAPDTAILMMTGFADQRDAALGLELSVHDILIKPFSLAALRSKVKDALASHGAEAA